MSWQWPRGGKLGGAVRRLQVTFRKTSWFGDVTLLWDEMRLFHPVEDGGCQQTTHTAERGAQGLPPGRGDRFGGRNWLTEEQSNYTSR